VKDLGGRHQPTGQVLWGTSTTPLTKLQASNTTNGLRSRFIANSCRLQVAVTLHSFRTYDAYSTGRRRPWSFSPCIHDYTVQGRKSANGEATRQRPTSTRSRSLRSFKLGETFISLPVAYRIRALALDVCSNSSSMLASKAKVHDTKIRACMVRLRFGFMQIGLRSIFRPEYFTIIMCNRRFSASTADQI
jgi:hypothetical protein